MAEAVDKIGVVRDHRWARAADQVKLLASRCPKVVSLGGGTVLQVSRESLEGLVRPGTVIELVHAFLLADPRRRRLAGGMKADFRAALARLEKRGAAVVDVDTSLSTAKPGHRKALLALVDSDISRSNRGARSATNGAKSKGRPRGVFTADQVRDAKAVWRNVKDYPTWADAAKAMPEGFTPARAFKLWQGRK